MKIDTQKTLQNSGVYGDPQIVCPVCGDQYSHVRGAVTLLGNDPDEGGFIYPGTKPAGFVKERRDALAVEVEGETCGHRWLVIFQQHKGITLLGYRVLPAEDRLSGPRVKPPFSEATQ